MGKRIHSLRFAFILVLGIGFIIFTAAFIILSRGIVLEALFRSENVYVDRQGIAAADIFEKIEQALNLLVLFLVGGLILLVLVVYGIMVRYFLSPLERLSRDIHKITSGNRLDTGSYSSSNEFQILCSSINNMLEKLNQSSVSTNVFKSILNSIGADLYVSDPESYEILFINDSMKAHYGLDDRVIGQTCWKVFYQGFEGPCPFCPNKKLSENSGTVEVSEVFNNLTNRYYKNTDCLIEWGKNKYAHLQHSVDISELKAAGATLKKRLQQQELMSAISQTFISSESQATLLHNALLMIGRFMNVGKTVLLKLNTAANTLEFEHEWYNDGQDLPRLSKQSLPFKPGEIFYDTFITQGDVYLTCNNVDENPKLAALYASQGIKAFINVPIFVYGQFWGVLGINDCLLKHAWDESDIQTLRLIANAIAGLIIRNNTEEQLVRMSSIVNSSPLYISYITPSGRFEYFNQGVLSSTGYSADELKTHGIYLLFNEHTGQQIRKKFIPQILEQGTFQAEIPLIRKDGEIRILSLSAFTTDAKKDGIGVIASDITEKRQLERDLIAAKEQAEQSNLAKSNFLSRMSHEMRTPMNAIIGMTTIAQSSHDPERKEYCLAKINEASNHLLGVINDILDMSKIEAGKFELSYTEFNFEKMLQRITNVMNFKFDEKHQNFVVRVARDVPESIIADEQRLAQILTNLLSNAGKFTPESGTIILAIKKRANDAIDNNKLCTLHFEVTDTGIGIAPDQQKRLFSLFEQADGSIARKYGGTGLGLSISKSLVELMGGEIWVESELEKGATFFFEITVERGTSQNSREGLKVQINWEKIHILVVDDSPEVLEYFKDFTESKGIRCSVASDGIEAYDLIKAGYDQVTGETPFDLVFADWRMPRMNGIELTKKIKEQFGEHVVVIMISAAEWETIETDAKNAGVDGFIPKPLFPSQIVDCISTHLNLQKFVTEKPAEESPGDRIFEGFTLLLAEDVEINREIVLTLLEDTGITIDCAENGIEALAMFKEAPARYQLILMDIHMPEMDGFEATRQIRALEVKEAKTVTIMAMTANVFREDIEKCFAAGMNDHLGKPIDIDELLEKLKKHLLRPAH
ncbi:response regulator [Treponema sp. TIM-1]|uniref:response regulator n=1 Tax=Treponema sp. TIM-1 TaxID=2898417 RepID=UPI00397ED4D9